MSHSYDRAANRCYVPIKGLPCASAVTAVGVQLADGDKASAIEVIRRMPKPAT
jgi:hypothetical protein